MATKPILRRAVAGTKSKASDYNWNFDQILDYVDNSVIELNEAITNNSNNVDELKDYVYNIGTPIITLESVLNEHEIWLEGAEVSKTDYQNLYDIYGDTYGEATDTNNFVLPDFRDRAIWGANDFGYISQGLPNITGGIWNIRGSDGLSTTYGAIWNNTTGTNGANSPGAVSCKNIHFDASMSNSIYGSSSNVQPNAIKVRVKTRYM